MPDRTPQIETLVTSCSGRDQTMGQTMTAATKINGFFFDPASARPLGICRAIFYLLLLLTYGGVNYGAFGGFPASFRNPIWIFQICHIPIVSSRLLVMLGWIFKLSLFASAIGLCTRVSTAVAAIVGAYVLGGAELFWTRGARRRCDS